MAVVAYRRGVIRGAGAVVAATIAALQQPQAVDNHPSAAAAQPCCANCEGDHRQCIAMLKLNFIYQLLVTCTQTEQFYDTNKVPHWNILIILVFLYAAGSYHDENYFIKGRSNILNWPPLLKCSGSSKGAYILPLTFYRTTLITASGLFYSSSVKHSLIITSKCCCTS